MSYITISDFYNDNKSRLKLKVLSGESRFFKKKIIVPDINRPGLAFAGFFDYFPFERVQVIGKTELTYLKKLGRVKANKVLRAVFKYNICVFIVSRNLPLPYDFLKLARKNMIPVLSSSVFTTKLITVIMMYLEKKLAPRKTIHGTFVDVYGVGVVTVGKSGIGKSEIALELVKRGHRLVADDLIEITRLGDDSLEGRGLNIVHHHMEIRGVGIVDVRNLFGIGAVRERQKVDLVIHLEDWEKGKDYERLGIDDKFEDILGLKVPRIIVPVRPGRNVSVIIEVAAMTQRLKAKGYNPAKELNKTIMKWMRKEKRNVSH